MIRLDLQKLTRELLSHVPTEAQLESLRSALATAARVEWVRLAQQNLGTTARDYIRGISEIERDGKVYVITLTGTVPNMVEKGWAARNLQETLLGPGAENRKKSKDGYYNTVPFRHAAQKGVKMGAANILPRAIQTAAQKLTPHTSALGQRFRGDSLTEHTPGISRHAKKHLQTKLKEHHSHSVFHGLIRQEQRVKGGTQNTYMTFRRISTNSDPDKWNHPGITRRNFADDVRAYVRRIGPALVESHRKSGRGV